MNAKGRNMRGFVLAVVLFLATPLIVTAAERDDAESWPMYGKNLQHTFANPLSKVNPTTVSKLQLAWTFQTGDAVTASAAVVDGVVYTGSWDGFFFALDARSGRLKWRIQLDCQKS